MTCRKCPHCGEKAYSAASQEKVWECPNCGGEISREREIPLEAWAKANPFLFDGKEGLN